MYPVARAAETMEPDRPRRGERASPIHILLRPAIALRAVEEIETHASGWGLENRPEIPGKIIRQHLLDRGQIETP